MKAIVCERYGSPEVLRLRHVEMPVPQRHEVLIKVHATTVSSGDWRVRSRTVPAGFGPLAPLFLGFRGPRQPILGTELSGEIEAVGAGVTRWKVGDAVLAFSGARMGCHAEYKTMPEDGALAMKPANLSHAEAASLCFGGTTALDFLHRGRVKVGERVLVVGASGAVGTATIQLARLLGARVTGVCSGANAALVRSLGAEDVIDYTKQNFIEACASSKASFDVIVDTVGTAPFSRCRQLLAPGGRLLAVAATLGELAAAPFVSLVGGKKVVAGPAAERPEDVRRLAALAAAGKLRPVIDRRFRFEDIAEAHRHVDSGRKRGSVVVTVVEEAAVAPAAHLVGQA
jgi:NADPH:quinone reductase-like Zn-dependent oxidoreductase